MNSERKYVAVSIKHTERGWKFGKPCVLWGYKHTSDDERRCFGGYTEDFNKAERYALGDFSAHGYGDIKDDEPVPMSIDFCRRWRNYDTVLVEEDMYRAYCKVTGMPTEETE